MTLEQLARTWQEEARRIRERYGLEAIAKLCEAHAAELTEAIREAADEELTLEEAARESGYSKRRLRELISEGTVPNAGEKGRPRVRRGDLPRKRSGPTNGDGFDARGHARSVLR